MPRRTPSNTHTRNVRHLQQEIDDLRMKQGPSGPAGPAGSTGGQGADGRTVLSGTSNPTAGIGQDGDFYINTNLWTIFGPKTGGSWGLGVSIVGATGSQGIQGVPGPNTLPVTSINTAPGRAINTTYQIHATRPSIVIYSVQLHTQLGALGTSSARMDLRSDATGTPTTQKSVVMNSRSLTLGISVGESLDVINNLVAFIAAGDNVRLVPTTSNGGTATFTQQLEIVL